MTGFVNNIKNIKHSEEKKRFLLFGVGLLLILFLAGYLLSVAYARYEARTKLNANIEKALYIFGTDTLTFNLFEDGIIPRDEPYTYKFSVSNYNANHQSDVDILYDVKVRTTTNLPITVELYRNEEYDATGAVNVFGGAVSSKDEDGAWYRNYSNTNSYEMLYENRHTDIYTLVIKFPSVYAQDTTYANYLECIELTLDSRQEV